MSLSDPSRSERFQSKDSNICVLHIILQLRYLFFCYRVVVIIFSKGMGPIIFLLVVFFEPIRTCPHEMTEPLIQRFLCVEVSIYKGERMRKMIVFLLIVGVFLVGTFAITEEITEEVMSQENVDFSEGESFTDSGYGDPAPCGGAQGGEGDAVG